MLLNGKNIGYDDSHIESGDSLWRQGAGIGKLSLRVF